MGSKLKQQLSNFIASYKFILLSLVSFGIYEQIWFYRHWKYFKEKEKLRISPFWRAVFAVFFLYSLFEHMQKYAKKSGTKFSSGWYTFFWIGILLMGFLPGLFSFVSSLGFLPLLKPLNTMNEYWKKQGRKYAPRRLLWWHIILLLLCLVVWGISIYQMIAEFPGFF